MLKRKDNKEKKKKIRRHQPSRTKLDLAISRILDKAINADSANAPKQLQLILTTEHADWKLPERRVAKYLKRQLKERNDPKYTLIDADLEAASIYSNTSTSTWRTKESTTPLREAARADAEEKQAEVEELAALDVISPVTNGDAYAEDPEEKKGKDVPLFCEGCKGGCIIS